MLGVRLGQLAARHQVVNQGGHIGDGHFTATIHVGISKIDMRSVTAQQVIDQGGHIGDRHVAVIIHVTSQAGDAGIKLPVAIVPIPMIDIPIFGIGLVDLTGSDDVPRDDRRSRKPCGGNRSAPGRRRACLAAGRAVPGGRRKLCDRIPD